MKYPPVCSAHWEGAVGQWLRGQLYHLGIDSPAYGRYVLSLLTKPLDPADLSPSPIGNKMWDMRCQSNWSPDKIEALKRSAAVQFLINACDDQDSGFEQVIEQLVDELCVKLKEVEEENAQTGKKELQSAKNTRKDRSRPLSPSEMARKYYAAFPALVPTTLTIDPSTDPVLVYNTFADSTARYLASIQKHKETFPSSKFGTVSNKDCSRIKKIGWKERRNSAHNHRFHNRGGKNKMAYYKYESEKLPEWVNNGDVWDIENQDPLEDYVRLAVVNEDYNVDDVDAHEVSSTKRLYERDPDTCVNLDGDGLFPKHCTNEIDAKFFEHSPAEEESMVKFKAKFDRSLEALWPKEQNNNIDCELAMDLNNIVSPSDRIFDCYSADNPLPLSLSIWSNVESTKQDWAYNDMVLIGQQLRARLLEPVIVDKQNVLKVNAELYNKESMEVIYNKLKPLNLDDSDDSSGNIDKTSMPTNSMNNQVINKPNSSMDPHCPNGTPVNSYLILNHDSSTSSFIEVIPKAPTGIIGDNLRKNTNHFKMDLPNPLNNPEVKKEEDLLYSTKTHFRPIKQDSQDDTAVNYDDGVTFPVVSDLDDVKFNRSSSGTIFLESDSEPPKQYMEYRKEGIDYSRLDISPSSFCSDEGLQQNDLVLKFRVCQTEKGVQTDNGKCMKKSETPNISPKFPSDEIASSSRTLESDNELEAPNYNWVQCDDCKHSNNQWISNNFHPVKLNSSKIWSLDDNSCKACAEKQMKMEKQPNSIGKNKIYEEESDKDWDEILSDLKYIHDLKSNDGWQDDLKTPSENCYIAPSEISYQAIDGNFVKSALMCEKTEKTESSVIEDVKAWLANTVEKTETNTVGRILDQSVIMYSNVEPHCEMFVEDTVKSQDLESGWRLDRKRRHSAVNGGTIEVEGKLRCTLPMPALALHLPTLPTVDRPLTR